jgi:hypothetical protein
MSFESGCIFPIGGGDQSCVNIAMSLSVLATSFKKTLKDTSICLYLLPSISVVS